MSAPPRTATMASKRTQPEGMQKEAHVLSQLAGVPSMSRAWIREDATDSIMHFTALYSQRNIAANAQRKYTVSYTAVATGGGLTIVPGHPVELKDVLLYAPSPSGQMVLVVRAGKDATSTVLELWESSRVIAELQIPAKLHGSVFADGWFSNGAAWDPSESRIAYVAEVPADTETPEWVSLATSKPSQDTKEDGKHEKSPKAAPKTWRGVGEFEDDWGELYTGKRAPGIFILDLKTFIVQPMAGTPENSSVGQPIWSPTGDELVYVAWPHEPVNSPGLSGRLGIVYCVNRACALYSMSLPHELSPTSGNPEEAASRCLTPTLSSALSPRFTLDKERILFLSHSAAASSGAHNATAALCSLPWPCSSGDSATEVVAVTRQPQEEHCFPGLYATALPDQLFQTSELALLTSQWRNTAQVVAVDIERGTADKWASSAGAQDSTSRGSCAVLSSYNGWTITTHSAPDVVPYTTVSHTSMASQETIPESKCSPQKLLDTLSWRTLKLKAGGSDAGGVAHFDATVVLGRPKEAAPGILFLHGGPHSAYAASYVHSVAFLASLGYNVVIPNYRGSTGYGEDGIQSLPGNIGTNDVADCMTALDAAITEGLVDKARVAVIGGSHGGFLTGNLVGQHPDRFRCGVLRNPVMDISLMISVSDIPDWCFVEATGSKEGMTVQPTPDQLARFHEVSPIAHVDKVQAPLLFMLGAKDRRVPLVDPQQYARALKARKDAPEVKIWVFSEDTHSLDKPQTDFEQWMNVAWWLRRHMQ
ncbi:g1438 [Coccomyxa viridis]|uniref:Prolyl endopeptidase n=1 Tax=Coccomyxa viridis TaxID=1274662 RepID=A0ABP1FI08_9CHLO